MNLKPILAAIVIAFPASALAQLAPPATPPAELTDLAKAGADHAKAAADKAKATHLYRQAEHNRELAEIQWEIANELWEERQEQLNKYHKYQDSSPLPQRPGR